MEILPKVLLKDEQVDLLFIYILMPQHRVMTVVLGSGMASISASEFAENYIRDQSVAAASAARDSGKPVAEARFPNVPSCS